MESLDLTRHLAARIADGADKPISQVIVEEVWVSVVEGTLDTGERLPTARRLAIALGVSPGTVERAYADLERLGVVAARRGEGTCVPAPSSSGAAASRTGRARARS